MNKEDKDWLINTFPTFQGRVLKGEVKSAYLRAEMLINGWDKIKARGCGCEMGSLKAQTDIKYNNWLQFNGKET